MPPKSPLSTSLLLDATVRSSPDYELSRQDTEVAAAPCESESLPSYETTPALESRDVTLPRPGTVVDDTYRIIRELGRGAMGVVMLARDERLERFVALKLIRDNTIQPAFRKLFMREAQAMARVSHPNVLGIHAFGEHDSLPYFVTEHVEGQTLEQWLAERLEPPPLELALRIMGDVCEGVAAIHEAGTVHRDLKPSNILLDSNLRTRVADFGVSRNYRDRDTQLCEMVGTPAYMAPEVALAAGELGKPSTLADVYSLGCIAFELLTGKQLFKAQGAMGWILRNMTEPIKTPSELRPDLPTEFDVVLLQALAKSPRERTPSAKAFGRALAGAAQGDLEPTRILVAEDDEDFRELLRAGLEQAFPSTEVECVGDGGSALDSLDKKPASIALIDLQMPTLDGVSVTATLRKGEAAAHMPILVLTGLGGAEEWRRLAKMGADGFLVKPFRLEDLITLVRRSLRERRHQAALS